MVGLSGTSPSTPPPFSPQVIRAEPRVDVTGTGVDVTGTGVDVTGNIVDITGTRVDGMGGGVGVTGTRLSTARAYFNRVLGLENTSEASRG
eukprot:1188610-Prorocentrum_minimum.AAC.1